MSEKFKYQWKSSNLREKVWELPPGNYEKCTGGKIVFQMCASIPGICGIAGILAGKILKNSPAKIFCRKRLFPTNDFERKWEISPGTNMKNLPAGICYYRRVFVITGGNLSLPAEIDVNSMLWCSISRMFRLLSGQRGLKDVRKCRQNKSESKGRQKMSVTSGKFAHAQR